MKRAVLFLFLGSSLSLHAQNTHAASPEATSYLDGVKMNIGPGKNRAASLYLTATTIAEDKDGNERVIPERVLSLIAKRNGPRFSSSFHNGGEGFLNQLALYPDQCIPKLTIASHGWGGSKSEGGEGVPIYAGVNSTDNPATGFYLDEATRSAEVDNAVNRYSEAYKNATPPLTQKEIDQVFNQYNEKSKKYARTLADLKRLMTAGKVNVVDDQGKAELILAAFADGKDKVRFCNECLIQLYGCNTGDQFANELSKTTGCQVVYGTGNVAPVDFTGNNLGLNPKTGDLNHVWIGDRKANNKRNGAIYRITPIKDGARVKSTHKEQLTTPGKSAWDSVQMRVVPFGEIRKN